MTKAIAIFSVIILSAFVFTSCQKDDQEPKASELLTNEIWKGTTASAGAMGYAMQTEDISTVTLEFLYNDTVNLYDGGELQGTGTWSLSNNDTTLNLSIDESIDVGGMDFSLNEVTVETLTETELTLAGKQTVNYQGFEIEVEYSANFEH